MVCPHELVIWNGKPTPGEVCQLHQRDSRRAETEVTQWSLPGSVTRGRKAAKDSKRVSRSLKRKVLNTSAGETPFLPTARSPFKKHTQQKQNQKPTEPPRRSGGTAVTNRTPGPAKVATKVHLERKEERGRGHFWVGGASSQGTSPSSRTGEPTEPVHSWPRHSPTPDHGPPGKSGASPGAEHSPSPPRRRSGRQACLHPRRPVFFRPQPGLARWRPPSPPPRLTGGGVCAASPLACLGAHEQHEQQQRGQDAQLAHEQLLPSPATLAPARAQHRDGRGGTAGQRRSAEKQPEPEPVFSARRGAPGPSACLPARLPARSELPLCLACASLTRSSVRAASKRCCRRRHCLESGQGARRRGGGEALRHGQGSLAAAPPRRLRLSAPAAPAAAKRQRSGAPLATRIRPPFCGLGVLHRPPLLPSPSPQSVLVSGWRGGSQEAPPAVSREMAAPAPFSGPAWKGFVLQRSSLSLYAEL